MHEEFTPRPWDWAFSTEIPPHPDIVSSWEISKSSLNSDLIRETDTFFCIHPKSRFLRLKWRYLTWNWSKSCFETEISHLTFPQIQISSLETKIFHLRLLQIQISPLRLRFLTWDWDFSPETPLDLDLAPWDWDISPETPPDPDLAPETEISHLRLRFLTRDYSRSRSRHWDWEV